MSTPILSHVWRMREEWGEREISQMGTLVEATRENFAELTASGRVLVDVWGPECQPCFTLMPYVERLAAEHADLTVAKLEAPKARRICIDLHVMGLPTFLLFENGEEVSRIGGSDLSAAQLEKWIHQALHEGKE
jgi:thioredoxin-like negative regulator of GroEL